MAKKVRIFFINCPSLAVDAAAFLLLAQNRVQQTLQFEVHHFWLYSRTADGPLDGWWGRLIARDEDSFHTFSRRFERRYRTQLDLRAAPAFRNEIPLGREWESTVRDVIQSYDQWFLSTKYNHYEFDSNVPAIVITETPLYGKYISFTGTGIAILGAAHWREFLGNESVSALEYLLTGVQRLSLRLAYGRIGSHFPTRGCIWDFDVHQPDVKINLYLGYLCDACRRQLSSSVTESEFSQIVALLRNDWFGDESIPGSVAGILKKDYRYSLSRSTGLHSSVLSTIGDSMKTEFGKFLIEAAKWILIIVASIFFLTYFPDLTNRWRALMSAPEKSEVEKKPTLDTVESNAPSSPTPEP